MKTQPVRSKRKSTKSPPNPVLENPVEIDPAAIDAKSPKDHIYRGWLYLYQKAYEKAEDDFTQALTLEPDNLDTLFALGISQKLVGKSDLSVRTFEQVIQLAGGIEDRTRSNMMKRLAKGHIQHIKIGDWDLEKELWKTKN
jgi:tetratricopeptide (TPR) repeat protein